MQIHWDISTLFFTKLDNKKNKTVEQKIKVPYETCHESLDFTSHASKLELNYRVTLKKKFLPHKMIHMI